MLLALLFGCPTPDPSYKTAVDDNAAASTSNAAQIADLLSRIEDLEAALADGAVGLSCWDRNENGVKDNAEDVNDDGVVDVDDCRGEDGADGADGETGADGNDGLAGLACWDLDEDGVEDPAEDVNSDLAWDVADCRGLDGTDGTDGLDGDDGADGLPGLACWDTDMDGIEDAAEDVNNDLAWDVLDCQGPQGDQGPQGIAGNDGADGAQGLPGNDGADGNDGNDGAPGSPGADGAPGADGLACWDANGNGALDDAEDIVDDDVGTAADCVPTWFVPSSTTVAATTVAEVEQALADLDGQRLAASAIVTIQLSTAFYDFSQPLMVDHPDGRNIHIVGTGSSNTVLRFPGSDGVVIPEGRQLGLLDALAITGQDTSSGDGVRASGNAVALLGGDVVVSDFLGDGVVAESGAFVEADGVRADSNRTGFRAFLGGVIAANNATANDNDDANIMAESGRVDATSAVVSGGTGDGFLASVGGTIHAELSQALGGANTLAGMLARRGSTIFAPSSTVTDNGSHGLNAQVDSSIVADDQGMGATVLARNNNGAVAQMMSLVFASGAAADDNSQHGFESVHRSMIWARSTTGAGNAGYGYAGAYDGYIDAASGSTTGTQGSAFPSATAGDPGSVITQ